jgi:DNA repair protein RadC
VLQAPTALIRDATRAEPPASLLRTVRAAITYALRVETRNAPVFPDLSAVLDYLRADLAHAPTEEVRVLCLDTKNRLIRESLISLGTVDEATIYPREIVKAALESNATGFILAHNHPSGDPTPSRADREATASVAQAAQTVRLRFHDHLIVARSGHTSFRQLGLL